MGGKKKLTITSDGGRLDHHKSVRGSVMFKLQTHFTRVDDCYINLSIQIRFYELCKSSFTFYKVKNAAIPLFLTSQQKRNE